MLAVSSSRPFSRKIGPMPDIPICCWNFCHNVDPGRMPTSKAEQLAKAARAAELAGGVAKASIMMPNSAKKELAQ